MADEQKTQAIGYLSDETMSKLPGWDTYLDATRALTEARSKSEEEKGKIRELIKQALSINPDWDIDFVVEDDGNRVRVYRNLIPKKGRGKKAATLDANFRVPVAAPGNPQGGWQAPEPPISSTSARAKIDEFKRRQQAGKE